MSPWLARFLIHWLIRSILSFSPRRRFILLLFRCMVDRGIAITDTRYAIRRILRPQGILPAAAGYPIRRILRPLGILALAAGIRSVARSAMRYPTFSGGYPIRRISPPAGYPTISGRYPSHRAVRPLGLSQEAVNPPPIGIPRKVRIASLAAGIQFVWYSVWRISIPHDTPPTGNPTVIGGYPIHRLPRPVDNPISSR